MVNGIVSFISLSYLLLLVYRNARDFCVLILYPATFVDVSNKNFISQLVLSRVKYKENRFKGNL